MEKENNSLDKLALSLENPLYEIAERLRKEGYAIAGYMGVKQKKPSANMIGILKERKPLEKRFFVFKYHQHQRAFHLGTIWLNNPEIGASEDKKWVLKIYGKDYQAKLTKIIEKVSSPYGIEVEVILSRKTPKRETYLFELGD